jgi:hypothetical protein
MVGPSPLLPTIAASSANSEVVTRAALQPLVDAAISRWAAAGLDPAKVAMLATVPVTIADLSGAGYLGCASSDQVVIDDDGAGLGWFVDVTPTIDEEFAATGLALTASAGSPVASRMDLLTVVMHELGHALGLSDLDPQTYAEQLMSGRLGVGQRRMVAATESEGRRSADLSFLIAEDHSSDASSRNNRATDYECAADRVLAESECHWTSNSPSPARVAAKVEPRRVHGKQAESSQSQRRKSLAAECDAALSDLLDDLDIKRHFRSEESL